MIFLFSFPFVSSVYFSSLAFLVLFPFSSLLLSTYLYFFSSASFTVFPSFSCFFSSFSFCISSVYQSSLLLYLLVFPVSVYFSSLFLPLTSLNLFPSPFFIFPGRSLHSLSLVSFIYSQLSPVFLYLFNLSSFIKQPFLLSFDAFPFFSSYKQPFPHFFFCLFSNPFL